MAYIGKEPVPVVAGGTGVAANTAYAVLCGGTTTTGAVQSIASVGTSGQILTSGGAATLPTFQTGAFLSPYVVDAVAGAAPYQTISAALTAANAAGGGTVYIRPGTYTESLTWPINVSVIGACLGSSDAPVIVVGNQTVTAVGSLKLRNIKFSCAAGVLWTIGAAGSATAVDFQTCNLANAAANNAIKLNIANATTFTLNNCILSSGDNHIQFIGGTSSIFNCTFSGAGNAFYVGANATINFRENNVSSSQYSFQIDSATANLTSINNKYTAISIAGYTAGGTITSINDEVNASDATYAIQSGGAYGTFNVSNLALLGTGKAIDPQITTTYYPTLNQQVWIDVTGTTQALKQNTGYTANNGALVTLTLPVKANYGSTIEVVGKGAGGWLIAQNASQMIHYISVTTTTGVGGSLASTARYDSVKLLCTVADLEWTVIASEGNHTVV